MGEVFSPPKKVHHPPPWISNGAALNMCGKDTDLGIGLETLNFKKMQPILVPVLLDLTCISSQNNIIFDNINVSLSSPQAFLIPHSCFKQRYFCRLDIDTMTL